jgi:hypothetical protein
MSAFVLLSMARSLRNCLFSSDAAQWWPGVWGWTGPVGHGLDTGTGWVRVNSVREGVPLWGFLAAAYRRKDLVNLFHFSSDPPSSPSKAPLPGKSCPYTYERLRRPFPVHPGGCQPHLIKEVTSCFRVDRRRDDHFFG